MRFLTRSLLTAAWHQFRDQIARVKDTDAIPLVLVGNKCDLPANERQVKTQEGETLAKNLKCDFTEASAKTCVNVDRGTSAPWPPRAALTEAQCCSILFGGAANSRQEAGRRRREKGRPERQKGQERRLHALVILQKDRCLSGGHRRPRSEHQQKSFE